MCLARRPIVHGGLLGRMGKQALHLLLDATPGALEVVTPQLAPGSRLLTGRHTAGSGIGWSEASLLCVTRNPRKPESEQGGSVLAEAPPIPRRLMLDLTCKLTDFLENGDTQSDSLRGVAHAATSGSLEPARRARTRGARWDSLARSCAHSQRQQHPHAPTEDPAFAVLARSLGPSQLGCATALRAERSSRRLGTRHRAICSAGPATSGRQSKAPAHSRTSQNAIDRC